MTLALAASAAILIAAGSYAITCWIAPFAACRRCEGEGKRTVHRWLLKDKTVRCSPCKGTGQRVRLGRRLHTRATRIHHDGTR